LRSARLASSPTVLLCRLCSIRCSCAPCLLDRLRIVVAFRVDCTVTSSPFFSDVTPLRCWCFSLETWNCSSCYSFLNQNGLNNG
jgi:hypothetical protein